MPNSNAETNKKYTIEDLPQFFQKKSEDIGKAFSDEIIEIGTISSESIKNNMQEFSFKLELNPEVNSNPQKVHAKIFHKIKGLIIFLKPCLKQGEIFKFEIEGLQPVSDKKNWFRKIANAATDKVSASLSKACHNVVGNKRDAEDEEIRMFVWSIFRGIFGSEINAQNFGIAIKQEILKVLQQGITIKLRANIKDINLDNLHKIEADLKEKLKQAKNNEQSQVALQVAETQQETAQNKQVVPFTGSFSFRVAREINCKAPVVTAAIENNIPKYRIFFPLSNFLNDVIRLFFSRTPKLSTQKLLAITYHPEPQEAKQDEVREEKNLAPKKNETSSSEVKENHTENKDITAEHKLTQVEENRTKKEHITAEPTLTQRVKRSLGIINDDDIQAQKIIALANGYARTEMISNEIKANDKQKTLDEIFCETVVAYHNPKYPKLLMEITESVFKTIFLKDISKKREVSEEDILNTLKDFSLEFNKNYLMQQIERKKEMLNCSIQRSNFSCISSVNKSEIQELYNFAQKKAQDAMKNNNDKALDEIFIKVMKNYTDQDRKTFSRIFDTVFNSIFCEDKNRDKIETLEEVFNILKLEVQFDAKYLEERVNEKNAIVCTST
ncbi:hypothetical protein [Wolbachia endosymbiont (group E) of Neria commutata]|uniref:hypothetical protein n=1 Tax=Wolbachia endosymbiont (group E) of Neria commutata TaxID=3066149 RepID=UPI003132FEF5